MLIFIYLISILFVLISTIYLLFKRSYKFWSNLNVPYVEPTFPFGNVGGTKKKHLALITQDIYKKLKGQNEYGGMFIFNQPILFVIEAEFVKTILVRDFNYFMNRGVYFNKKHDPLSGSLFSIEGNVWKVLRQKLTPAFTSGKMKMMFHTVADVADVLTKYIDENCSQKSEIDIKELVGCFTTDIVSSCIFGVEGNTINNPDSEFRQILCKALTFSKFKKFLLFGAMVYRKQARALGFTGYHKESTEFFNQLVHTTIGFRKENNIHRNDLMQIMMELMRQDYESNEGLTIDEVAANSFLFFFAGFETSSTTLTISLYNLALNTDIQDNTRKEVQRILDKYDGKLTYEGVMEFDLLERILFESLRIFPPLPTLHRVANKPYKLPNGSEIPEGTQVIIPVYAIHHDAENYPEPEKFDPERFTEENKKTRHPYSFIPFGDGPRICIGLRFALMQTKVGLASILRNFRIEVCDKTQIPIRADMEPLTWSPDGQVWLKFVKI